MPRRRRPERVAHFWDSVTRDHLSLFKVPPQLDLTPGIEYADQRAIIESEKSPTTPSSCAAPRRAASITSLPPELILEIASYLHPVDRICLGLTCKFLLSSTLATLRITAIDWVRFHDRRYSYILPQLPTLYVRLAHGWVPRDKYRYCSRCYKILPRCPEYFKQRLRKKKKPAFDGRIAYMGVTEKKWRSMSKTARYAHLIQDWCQSSKSDSSDMFCSFCAPRQRERGNCSVHCPLCLERDLTYRPPRRPWVRNALARGCRKFWTPWELLCYWILFVIVWSAKFVWELGAQIWTASRGCFRSRGHDGGSVVYY